MNEEGFVFLVVFLSDAKCIQYTVQFRDKVFSPIRFWVLFQGLPVSNQCALWVGRIGKGGGNGGGRGRDGGGMGAWLSPRVFCVCIFSLSLFLYLSAHYLGQGPHFNALTVWVKKRRQQDGHFRTFGTFGTLPNPKKEAQFSL